MVSAMEKFPEKWAECVAQFPEDMRPIAAGYGDRIEADRNYLPTRLVVYPTIELAVKAYVEAEETGVIYHDEIPDVYLLDLSEGDLQEWLAY